MLHKNHKIRYFYTKIEKYNTCTIIQIQLTFFKNMHKKSYFNCLCLLFIFIFFITNDILAQINIDIQGHRGCRGLMPENTIPAMKKALDLDVTTLEMDVVISKDKKVVISHDLFFSSKISLTPEGKNILKQEEKNHNLYKMNYVDIKKYDVGSKEYPDFPGQKKIKVYKPLLSELIDSIENYVQTKNLIKPFYNIEIKSSPKNDTIFHPVPDEFVKYVMEIINHKNLRKRVIIQSFDARPLQIIHGNYPEIKLALLVGNLKSISKNIENLGFVPDIYSPYYKLVRKKSVRKCHKMQMKIVPWTVNSKKRIDKMLHLQVDGIITDYPDLFNNTER